MDNAAALAGHLTGASPPPRFSYRFGTAEFDEARYELRVAGLPVEVERRALEVLACLLQRAGEVVGKDELLDTVWAGRVTVEKVLANAVAKLRRALGEANAAQIVTQARVGYRLAGPVSRQPVGAGHRIGLALASGQAVPGRENFVLREALAARRGSEVWLAAHTRTRERRVYKFALEGEGIRQLKREATLLRVLDAAAGEAGCFVELIDWRFEAPPYFLELAWAGENLAEWAGRHLAGMDRRQRLDLFLAIADAVAIAHAAGVLHKDIKPANILVEAGPDAPVVRLSDFGIGRLASPDGLERLGITAQGLTVTDSVGSELGSGTLHYAAPEVLAGQASTTRSDVYALGVLLFQLLAGDLRRPMASGWERDVDDPLLCGDIRAATDGRPEERPSNAAELAERVRLLQARREATEQAQALERDMAQAREALSRSRARRPWVVASLLVLAGALLVVLGLQQRTDLARNQAQAQLQRANAMLRFLEEDLVGRGNPLVAGQGAQVPFRDVLLAARDRLTARFADQPLTAARMRLSLATLFNTLDLWPEALAETGQALALLEGQGAAGADDAVRARAMRVKLLTRLARMEEARTELAALGEPGLAAESQAWRRFHRASAQASYLMVTGALAEAAPVLESALAAHDLIWPEGGAQRDSLVLDLIHVESFGGQGERAIARFEAFVAELAARPGDHASLRALAQLRVARAVSLGGDHARAEALLLAARPVIAERFGEEHSQMLGLLAELLGVHFRQGAWTQALPLARDVHARMAATLGEQHILTLVSLSNVGRTLFEAGQAQAAADALDQALAGLAATAGPDSPQAHDVLFYRVATALALDDADTARTGLARLQPGQLEKLRATGVWDEAVAVQEGLLANLEGDAPRALHLLDQALPVMATAEGHARSRLLARALQVREGLAAANAPAVR
ncbi:MAG: winged helix-turn-helix domain-containing protein [Xanthomonadales bacterium]|nr:winged helix-turn-helix domain-containing protein [Xanthomonadales bacterium]